MYKSVHTPAVSIAEYWNLKREHIMIMTILPFPTKQFIMYNVASIWSSKLSQWNKNIYVINRFQYSEHHYLFYINLFAHKNIFIFNW